MRRWSFATLAIALLMGSTARADEPALTITIGNVSINEGGSGFLDVMIKSTSGSPVNLAQAGYEFLITPDINVITNLPTTTTLQFTDPQPFGYLSDANYVFPQSGNLQFPPPGTVVDEVNYHNDHLSGGDNNFDGGFVNVAVTGDVLLIRLQLTANLSMLPGIPPVEGDTFKITLLTPDGPIGNATLFTDQDFVDVSYTSTVGTVTIIGRAVPEPGSLALLGIGLISGLGVMVRRKHSIRSSV